MVVGPEAPLVGGPGRRARGRRGAGVRPQRRGGAAGGLEGPRQGGDGARRACRPRVTRRAARAATKRSSGSPAPRIPTVLKADGLAAGKGVIIAESEAEAREAVEPFFVEQRFGADRGRPRGAPRWARSCRCWRSATARTSSRWRRPRTTSGSSTAMTGPNTGGMGSYSPVPGGRATTTVEELADEVHRPGRRAAAPQRDAVPRRALRGADDDRRRAHGSSSSTAGSAIPRPRRCCRGCARTWPSSSSPRASRAGWPA